MIVTSLLARLGFKLDRGSARAAQRFIGQARGGMERLTAANSGALLAQRRLFAGFVAFRALAGSGGFIGRTIVDTERLRALLTTLEGTAEGAQRAEEFIVRFASTTPFQIQQVTEAFLRLRGAGIDPSQERLAALGNVAATFQSNLANMVEAAQNAGRGMPRLLEGILRADVDAQTKQGKLLINLGGTIHEIDRSTESVVEFLEELGNTRFADAMANQMDTIVGRVSNLGDATTNFVRTMGDAGLTDAMTEFLGVLIEGINESESFAQTMGQALARGVRSATRALIWLRENTDVVVRALRVLTGAALSAQIVRFGFTLGSALAAATAPATLAAAALLAIPLLIEDVIGFIEGRPSLIGLMLGGDESEVSTQVRSVLSGLGDPISRILESVMGILQRVLGLFSKIANAIGIDVVQLALLPLMVGLETVAIIVEFIADAFEGISRLVDRVSEKINGIGDFARFFASPTAFIAQSVLGAPEERRSITIPEPGQGQPFRPGGLMESMQLTINQNMSFGPQQGAPSDLARGARTGADSGMEQARRTINRMMGRNSP